MCNYLLIYLDNIHFYKNQIVFLRQQLEENKQYNQLFLRQIETKDQEVEEDKKILNDFLKQYKVNGKALNESLGGVIKVEITYILDDQTYLPE